MLCNRSLGDTTVHQQKWMSHVKRWNFLANMALAQVRLSIAMFLRSVNEDRMMKFFKNDFSQDRWRKAALKNAFSLLGKQRFQHAAAFFLLGGAVNDAIEVRCFSTVATLSIKNNNNNKRSLFTINLRNCTIYVPKGCEFKKRNNIRSR